MLRLSMWLGLVSVLALLSAFGVEAVFPTALRFATYLAALSFVSFGLIWVATNAESGDVFPEPKRNELSDCHESRGGSTGG